MRVRVDEDLCAGDESCVDIGPQIFRMAGDVASVKREEVPEELEDSCKEAAEACPVQAVIIEE